MNDSGSDAKLRVDAAKALLRERAEAGKKELKQEAAKKAAGGKFAASAPPLKLIRGQ